ncbi:hypothetical protein COT30_03650 [Candidatus Micrarchaeota archaeon CG08_land_8_20_14_0_20_49_17]|nr:MAG: hypothetical protein COT30_03650 [Candidatus Micrarchaeota archaeon CG08_land_8_20_14_0_20_49_17]PIZ97795.1 MAG: hypothetical protein COX84_02865 [Candidatus Micrarchaeota archaeon CG_4_10_14_0_2_um_filter_49_7]
MIRSVASDVLGPMSRAAGELEPHSDINMGNIQRMLGYALTKLLSKAEKEREESSGKGTPPHMQQQGVRPNGGVGQSQCRRQPQAH